MHTVARNCPNTQWWWKINLIMNCTDWSWCENGAPPHSRQCCVSLARNFWCTLLAMDQLSGPQGLPTLCTVAFSKIKRKTRSLLMFCKWTNISMWNLTQKQTLKGVQQYVNHCFHVVWRLKTADSNLDNWWSSSLPLSVGGWLQRKQCVLERGSW